MRRSKYSTTYIPTVPVAGLLNSVEFSRRTFLQGAAILPILTSVSSASDPSEGELDLQWNSEQTILTIRVLDPDGSSSEMLPVWRLPKAAFGPDAEISHVVQINSKSKATEHLQHFVRVDRLRYGHINNRFIEFRFAKVEAKWTIVAESNFWSSERGPKVEHVFKLGYVRDAEKRVEHIPIAVDFAKFANCEESLNQLVWVGRVKNTCEMVFNGLLTTHSKSRERLYRVSLSCECVWSAQPFGVNSSPDIVHFDEYGRSNALTIAWHEQTSETSTRDTLGQPDYMLIGGTKELLNTLFLISGPANQRTILKSGNGKDRVKLVQAIVRTSDIAVDTQVFEHNNWHLDYTDVRLNGADIQTGPFIDLSGRVRQGLELPLGTLRGDTASQTQSIDFLGEYGAVSEHDTILKRKLSTPIGGVVFDPLRPNDDTVKFSQMRASETDPLDPLAARRVPISLYWRGSADPRKTAGLSLVKLDAGIYLRHSDMALPDSNFSSFAFQPTELWIRYRDKGEVWTDGVSEIALGPIAKGSDVARLDLSRARLAASRSVDLLHLDFRFSGLALHVTAESSNQHTLEVRRNVKLCGHIEEAAPAARSESHELDIGNRSPRDVAKTTRDRRPILSVEFPPQHILEEAVFRPALPRPPFVEVPATGNQKTKFVIQWKVPVDADFTPVVAERSIDAGSDGQSTKDKVAWIDPDSLLAMRTALSRLDTLQQRKKLRETVQKLKLKATAVENPEQEKNRLAFEQFKTDFAKFNTTLQPDQKVYIGPDYLGPEAWAAARATISADVNGKVTHIINGIFTSARKSAAPLVDNTGTPYSNHATNFQHALALEAKLEAEVPHYQLFRGYYRDVMTDLVLTPDERPNGWEGLEKPYLPKNLVGQDLEFVIDGLVDSAGTAIKNRMWPGANSLALQKRQSTAETAYAQYLTQLDDIRPTEGRVSRRSRLSFRVNCRGDETDVSTPQAARRLGFSLNDLTNWSNLELSVVRRAEEVLLPDITGSLGVSGDVRINSKPGAKLDHLGFQTGQSVDIYTRLHDIFAAVTEEPHDHQTYLELVARIGFSTNQLARFLTPHSLPDEIFSKPDDNADGNVDCLAEVELEPNANRNGIEQIGMHELWSAQLVTGGGQNHGLRVISSPDFRPGVIHRMSKRRDALDVGGNPPLPGDAPPPRGPLAPWFVGLDESATTSLGPRAIAAHEPNPNPNGKFGRSVKELVTATSNDDEFCEKIEPQTKINAGLRRLLPLDILAACGFRVRRKNLGARRTFRSSLDMYDRHELMLLSGTPGVPIEFGDISNLPSNLKKPPQFDPDRDLQLTGIFPGTKVYDPPSLNVINLALTSIGGSFHHSTGFLPFSPAKHLSGDRIMDATSIEHWEHHTELGKDIHVEVLYKGTLCPCGHPCSLVKVTQRSFLRETSGKKRYVGIPRQRMYIRYSSEDKLFPAVGQPNEGRASPFRTARILGDVTPDIIDPNANVDAIHPNPSNNKIFESDTGRLISPSGAAGLVFWPRTLRMPGAEVRFEFVLDDKAVTMPMIFVDNVAAKDPQMCKELSAYYNNEIKPPRPIGDEPHFNPVVHRRTVDMGGQKMRYATERKSGSTKQETVLWSFSIEGLQEYPPVISGGNVNLFNSSFVSGPALEAANQPPYYPKVQPHIRLTQSAVLTGAPVQIVEAAWDGRYLVDGFSDAADGAVPEDNEQELYLVLRSDVPQSMGDKGDRSGGMMRPDSQLVALSRLKGPVGFRSDENEPFVALAEAGRSNGANPSMTDKFNTTENKIQDVYRRYFNPDAKLLGVIKLSVMMEFIAESGLIEASGLPQLVEQVQYGVGQAESAVQDTAQFVRDEVLRPAQTLVATQRGRIKDINQAIEKKQKELGVNVTPLKFEEIFPGVQTSLGRLEASLATAIAPSDSIGFALALGEVFEAGRHFIEVLEQVSRSLGHNLEQAATERIQEEFSELSKLLNRLQDVYKKLQFDLKSASDGLIDEFSKNLARHVIPGEDDKGWLYLPLPYPLLVGEDPEIRQMLFPRCSEVRNQVSDILKEVLLDLKNNEPVAVDLAAVAKKIEVEVQDRTQSLIKKIGLGTVVPKRPETKDSILQFQLLITRPGDIFLDAMSEELIYLHEIWAAYDALSSEIKSGDIRVIFRRAIDLAELFIGPLDLSIDPLCDAINDASVDVLGSVAKLLELPFGVLATPTAEICNLDGDDQLLAKFMPTSGDLAVSIWEAHKATSGALNAVNEAKNADFEKFYLALQELGVTNDFPSEIDLMAALAKAEELTRSLRKTTGLFYCNIINDVRAVAALESQIVDFDICDLKVLEKQRSTITQAKAIIENRKRSIHELADRTVIITDELIVLSENEIFQKILAVATLAAAISALDTTSLTADLRKAVNDTQIKIKNLEDELNSLAMKLASNIEKILMYLAEQLSVVLPKAQKLLDTAKGFLPPTVVAEVTATLVTLSELQMEIASLRGKLSSVMTFADFANLTNEVNSIGQSVGNLIEYNTVSVSVKTTPLDRLIVLPNEVIGKISAFARHTPGDIFFSALDPLVSKGIGSSGLGLSNAFVEILTARNTLYDTIDDLIGTADLLLVPIKNGDTRTEVTNFPVDPKPEKDKDRLAADAEALNILSAAAMPLSVAENRAFLKRFINEFGSQQSSVEEILKNITGFIRKFARADFLIELGVDYITDQLESYLSQLVPARIELSYDFNTVIPSTVSELTAGVFEPLEGCALNVDMKAVINLQGVISGDSPSVEARSIAKIGAFDINLVGDFKALKLKFKGARFEAGTGREGSKFKVRYDDFVIGKELDFVQQLQSYLAPKEGSGPYVVALKGRPGIEAGYGLALGTLSIGNVSFFNVSINVAALLPFDSSEASFRASLSRRDAPFTISYAPFGGSGFFAIEANSAGIIGFEASFEFGGAAAFAAGPLTGQGRLMAGTYISQFILDERTKVTEISGTFFAGGSAAIWIFHFASSLYVKLGMINGDMTGEAIFTFSFSMGLADFDFSVSFQRTERKGFSSAEQAPESEAASTLRAASIMQKINDLEEKTVGSIKKDPGIALIKKGPSIVCQSENWNSYRGYFDESDHWTGEW